MSTKLLLAALFAGCLCLAGATDITQSTRAAGYRRLLQQQPAVPVNQQQQTAQKLLQQPTTAPEQPNKPVITQAQPQAQTQAQTQQPAAQPGQKAAAQPGQQPAAANPVPVVNGQAGDQQDEEEPTVMLVAIPSDEQPGAEVEEAGPGAEEGTAVDGETEDDSDDTDDDVAQAAGMGLVEAAPASTDELTGGDNEDEEEGAGPDMADGQEAGPGAAGDGVPCDESAADESGPAASGNAAGAPAALSGGEQCVTLDGDKLPNGRVCTVQVITTTTTTAVPACNDYKAACLKTTTKTQLLTPTGTAADNPAEYNQSAQAACQLLGYKAAGSGSVHVAGNAPEAQQVCYNGKLWATGNYWTVLVCCN